MSRLMNRSSIVNKSVPVKNDGTEASAAFRF